MNIKTTVILMALLVAAGVYIIIDRVVSSREPAEAVADSGKLFNVKSVDDVKSLTIKSGADNSEIVLTKDDANKWRMKKPVDAATDSWEVDSLVRSLVDLQPSAQVDPAGKGLDKPRYQVELSAKDGKLIKFAIGDKNQLGSMYIQVAGSKVADVVPSDVYDRLGKPANELRDKQLVNTPPAQVKQLVIQNEGQPKLVLQKSAAGGWELTEPQKLPVDETVMTDLLGAVTGLRASDWVAADSSTDLNRAQFDKPQATVAFTTAAPATQPTTAPASQPTWTTITFGQPENIRNEKVYARVSDSQAFVKVPVTSLETLNKKPLDLRDKKVLDVQPDQVSRLSIATDIPAAAAPSTRPATKSNVEIERRKQVAAATTVPATTQAASTRATQPATTQAAAPVKQSTWALKSEPRGDADDETVRNLLADLHPLRATRYLEAGPTTRPVGNYVIKLTTEGPGGTPVNDHQVTVVDPGNDQSLIGEYNSLRFEFPRTFLTRIEGNFASKPKTESKPAGGATPDDFKIPGEQ